jgi:hypothetical protein
VLGDIWSVSVVVCTRTRYYTRKGLIRSSALRTEPYKCYPRSLQTFPPATPQPALPTISSQNAHSFACSTSSIASSVTFSGLHPQYRDDHEKTGIQYSPCTSSSRICLPAARKTCVFAASAAVLPKKPTSVLMKCSTIFPSGLWGPLPREVKPTIPRLVEVWLVGSF